MRENLRSVKGFLNKRLTKFYTSLLTKTREGFQSVFHERLKKGYQKLVVRKLNETRRVRLSNRVRGLMICVLIVTISINRACQSRAATILSTRNNQVPYQSITIHVTNRAHHCIIKATQTIRSPPKK